MAIQFSGDFVMEGNFNSDSMMSGNSNDQRDSHERVIAKEAKQC